MERGKILFTGNRELMTNDLMQHLPDRYTMTKCSPSDLEFAEAVEQFQPHVVITCLMDESRDAMRMYRVLEEKAEFLHVPIIAIGHEEDCENFRKRVKVRNQHTFTRPFDRERLLEVLDSFIKMSMEMEQSAAVQETAAQPPKAPINAETPPAADPLVQKIERLIEIKGRKSILVVDDDVRMLNVIKLFLQDLYDITVVPSGKLALKYLAKKSADLVLLDYMMPDMDGPAVLQQIRTFSPIPNIPVVFLTGVDDREMVLRGLEYHPNGYLLKPVTRELLLEKVTEILLGI